MSYIVCENYCKSIKGNIVLNNISFNIAKGECIGLWGRNASGKTMLLRAISGLILPDSGTMKVDNLILSPKSRFPDSLGLIIENISFWPFMTGKNVLKTIAAIKNITDDAKIDKTMIRVGLDPLNIKNVGKYSLGMIQKLAIAQAIMEQPDLLLLDEPTNALDEGSRNKFYKILDEEIDRGATIVLASHTREDLESCCNRILYIDNGTIAK